MNETHKNPTALIGKSQAIKQIIEFFKSIQDGNNCAIGGDTTDDILSDLDCMWDCTYCTGLQNNFWCYMVPMETQVVVTCRYISAISILTFFVTRKAKLSLHRLKNGEFNHDEWRRIKNALHVLVKVDLAIYDLRRADVGDDVELDTNKDFAHIAF